MPTIRISDDRWEKLEKKEIQLIIECHKKIKKSDILNLLLDEMMERIEVKEDGKLFVKGISAVDRE